MVERVRPLARYVRLAVAAGTMLVAGVLHAAPSGLAPPAAARLDPGAPERTRVLDVNRLGLHVSNAGPFAWDLSTFRGGLEYPRGSGFELAFAAGPWLIGIAGSDTLTALSEFSWEFSPGPSTGGNAALDTLRHVVYRTARADTIGRAEWLERGVTVGAPLDESGSSPLLRGDLHLWTVFTDAATIPPRTPVSRFGSGPPIGVDATLSAYAFNRTGFASEAAFLEYRLVHRGATTLDSAWFGVFLDPLSNLGFLYTSYDTVQDLEIHYRPRDFNAFYGASGPALGLLWLRGPRNVTAPPLRPTSYVVYPNGADPRNVADCLGSMRSVRPFLGPMIDPTTGQPSRYWSTGDPVTGTGWVDTTIGHPHTVIAAGPFRFAPGDTQEVAVALLVARGSTRLESVSRLREHAAAAAAAWAEGFVNLPPSPPPPEPPRTPGRVWPNPAVQSAAIGWTALPGEPIQVDVFDVRGRRVCRMRLVTTQGPFGTSTWDLTDDDGRRVPPGLYLVRTTLRGSSTTARLVVLE